MAEALRDPKARFSDRVEDYIKYRPRYQVEVVEALRTACGLKLEHLVADVGCGTGFSAEPFLQNGNRVIGIEPNREMREAGEHYLQTYPKFEMREATAESTGLDDGSIDFVLAGQAFHWFRLPETRAEFARIVKPQGWVVLIWHDRGIEGTPFLRAYEAFLLKHAIDYDRVQHRQVANPEVIGKFFAPQEVRFISLRAEQRFDLEGLRGRLLSSSYIPREGERAEAMLREFPEFFAPFLVDGHIALEYETKVFYGHLRP